MEMGAYILAGGKSERMGQDKAQVKLGDKPMIEYVLDVAKIFVATPIIISNNEQHKKYGLCIPDLSKNGGPAVGILTALSHTVYEQNIILSCDMPLVSNLMIRSFSELMLTAEITCFGGDFLYPFPGVYSKNILPSWNLLMEQGERKLQQMIKSFDYKVLAIEDEDLLLNVNTPEDLEQAKEKLRL